MIVYYRDRSVEVTSAGIRVNEHHYPFEQLARVWYRRDARSWRAVAGRSAWGMTLVTPMVAAIAALVVALQLDVTAGTRTAIVVAALLLGFGAALLLDPVLGKMDESFDRGVHVHEIWAEHNGLQIKLLQTEDAARFGRIYRAVQRAAESS
jgi:hypothetical protein